MLYYSILDYKRRATLFCKNCGKTSYHADASLWVTGVRMAVTFTRLTVAKVQAPSCASVSRSAVLQNKKTKEQMSRLSNTVIIITVAWMQAFTTIHPIGHRAKLWLFIPGMTDHGNQEDTGTAPPPKPVPGQCSQAQRYPCGPLRYWMSAFLCDTRHGSRCHRGPRAPSSGVPV